VFWIVLYRSPPLQVFLQNYGCGDRVYGGSGRPMLTFAVCFRIVQGSAGLLFEQTLRFPAGEALIEHIHRQAQLLAQARGEAGDLFRHFTVRAIEAEGQTDNDLADSVVARKFAQSPHVFIAIDPLESEERPRELCLRFSNSQADPRAAVIHCQN
jgi:hypothetical protein